MLIPTDIPARINPYMQDPLQNSVVYTFPNEDIFHAQGPTYLYKLPYSRDTFWTNFKFSLYGVDNAELEIGIELVTSDGFSYDIAAAALKRPQVWHDTVWPLPSLDSGHNDGAIYIRVRPSSVFQLQNFRLQVLGFMDLFPKSQNYLLLTERYTYQFIFYMNEDNEQAGAQQPGGQQQPDGRIYNVENLVYVQDIVNNAQGIRLISQY
jgi:hypothetical protein